MQCTTQCDETDFRFLFLGGGVLECDGLEEGGLDSESKDKNALMSKTR
jgi:hypothetical protein